ncbi:hypothetical protein [Acidithiobacillus ferriphilus]|uniref:hypothetical protein n=1 Tax=Acidithiobacillus ferriphilus TaxID=1689834 RepID=UPI001C070C56|nr:hypothetical protein [Acidithiobacillus ferriphilus]MBU2852940.1 hypothetical protein [Acidithiobacillus ferriphilus]
MGEAQRRKLRGEYPLPGTPREHFVTRGVPDELFHRSMEVLSRFSLDDINKANDCYFSSTNKKDLFEFSTMSSEDVLEFAKMFMIATADAVACGRAYIKKGALCFYAPTPGDIHARRILKNGGSLVRNFSDFVSVLNVPEGGYGAGETS